jgi:hypothetical protein
MYEDKREGDERRRKLTEVMAKKKAVLRLHKEGTELLPPDEVERLVGLVKKIKDKLKRMDEVSANVHSSQ